jgi:L-alanine-DL-glutamate epimerase-like enolase superfamily enzyme
MLSISIAERHWPMREPFAIARGVQTEQATIMVTLTDAEGRFGRGEGCGVPYAGEDPAAMQAAIRAVESEICGLQRRSDLYRLLPPSGARCAVDCALWDLEAKQSGRRAWEAIGLAQLRPVVTALTIGIRDEHAYQAAAERYAAYPVLKVKVNAADPLAALRAVRRGAPAATLIVDPNQSWSVEQLRALAPRLADLGVALLEQPIPIGAEPGLDGYACPVPLCADELINDGGDLDKAQGRFSVINIKLDKTGGLTEAVAMADAAQARGFDLMVGCMAGSSLSMAPALIVAQRCRFVDLDGPLLQATDWPDGLVYDNGRIEPPPASFWG